MLMQFHEMKEIDLKMALLKGSSIKLENLEITPYTLSEIEDYGYSKYMGNLQWILASIDDFIDSILEESKREILEKQRDSLKAFDFYVRLGGKDMQDTLVEVLSMIFKTDDIMVLDDGVVALNFVKLGVAVKNDDGNIIGLNPDVLDDLDESEIKLIHRDNFDDIIKIVKLQNYLEQPKEAKKEEPHMDEETRKLVEHMEKMQREVERKKRQQQGDDDESDIDLSDIISAVSSKSNSMNKLNIWDYTLYQIYDEYARLELIDNYDFGIRAMMAGAKDVQLKHWSSRL